MNRILTTCALAVAIGTQASAVTFLFQYESPLTSSSGSFTVVATAPQIVNLPTIDAQAATGLNYTWTPGLGGGFTTGTGMISSASGSLTYSFLGTSSASGMNGAVVTFSNGTGAYAGYGGSGVVSHTVNSVNPNLVDGQFFAQIQSVPEPAPALAAGLGGLVLIRQRSGRRS